MLSANEIQHNGLLDRISLVFSGLCILHCLAVPVLLVLVPLGSGLVASDSHFHQAALLIIVPISLVAFGLGYRQHRQLSVPAVGLAGLSLLVAAAYWGHSAGLLAESVLSIGASALLIMAHWKNLRLNALGPKP